MGTTNVILLEHVDRLGGIGDEVSVKQGFARNYLLPQGKALRATEDNVAYFETQKAALEAENKKKRDAAAKEAKKVEGTTIALIRQASEGGQLYGSVSARDIADEATEKTGITIDRSHIDLNQNFKMVGLFPVTIALHPEVKVDITVNIARTEEEAKIQKESGQALISGNEQPTVKDEAAADAEEIFEDVPEELSEDAEATEEVEEEKTA